MNSSRVSFFEICKPLLRFVICGSADSTPPDFQIEGTRLKENLYSFLVGYQTEL
jgi:hypothetical protein